MTIQAIQTRYRGCHFRSRLEARWAVFFDALEIDWQYEPQGFIVSGCCYGPEDQVDETPYLPDFYLPHSETWVEVKGDTSSVNWQMYADAIDWGGCLPGVEASGWTTRGLLILGEIPHVPHEAAAAGWLPAHPILQHSKGGLVHLASFVGPRTGEPLLRIHDHEQEYFDSSWGAAGPEDAWVACILKHLPGRLGLEGLHPEAGLVAYAYAQARSARFEHGETPQPDRRIADRPVYADGAVVRHEKYGVGRVVRSRHAGTPEETVEIQFPAGTHRFRVSHVSLEQGEKPS